LIKIKAALQHNGGLNSQGRHYGMNNLRRRPPVQRVTVGGDMSKSLLVSVVEDDRSFRDSMSMLLSSFGYNVEAFASAGDFLASHRVSETACLIVDVNMPEMTGIELYQRLIKTGRAIPTILMTAYPNDADRARALDDGVLCYLCKPVDDQHLVGCLRVALASQEPPAEIS